MRRRVRRRGGRRRGVTASGRGRRCLSRPRPRTRHLTTGASHHRFCGGVRVRPAGAAVRGLTDESGREVLTVSGIFIAKFARTQRSQRGCWPQPNAGTAFPLLFGWRFSHTPSLTAGERNAVLAFGCGQRLRCKLPSAMRRDAVGYLPQRHVPGSNLAIVTAVRGLRCGTTDRFRRHMFNPRQNIEIAANLPSLVYPRYTRQQGRR